MEGKTKICTQCGAEKPLDQFSRQKLGKLGRTAACKPCRNPWAAKWRATNPEKLAAYMVATKERRAAYYLDNRDKILARRAARYAADPQKYIQQTIEWQRANRERHGKYVKAWQRANPEKCKAIDARRRARLLAATIEPFSYEAILWRDGHRCHICGGDVEPGTHHFDHVVPLARGGEHSYDNVRVAHAGCNQRKNAKLLEELS